MEPWLERFARANFTRSTDTAHDLKTPLNVAVLNLELLRMRIAKLGSAKGDEKITAYARSIETELRRMARIFDTFFILSTPPKGENGPAPIDIASLCAEAGEAAGFNMAGSGSFSMSAHESRIRQAFKMFFEGASHLLRSEGRNARAGKDGERFRVTVSGQPHSNELEIEKIFKFYYTDPLGNPELSLATARLIAETYGGELIATEERDNVVTLGLSFHQGDQQ
jgi:nitrogen fixation/metabolism regulation signal transduction histidine kinase